MANADFNEDFNKRRDSSSGAKTRKGGSQGTVKEKTASWGGLIGKAGPNRSGGTPKLKTFPKSKGI